jgi:hypothetical protein
VKQKQKAESRKWKWEANPVRLRFDRAKPMEAKETTILAGSQSNHADWINL